MTITLNSGDPRTINLVEGLMPAGDKIVFGEAVQDPKDVLIAELKLLLKHYERLADAQAEMIRGLKERALVNSMERVRFTPYSD